MKLQGMAGKGSGKLGSQVYAISGGEQIVRQYNPTVTNPSTEGQVETRSKFKLLSQLGAALSGVIAIKREGLVSGRNQFMKINKENAVYAGADASINLNHVQITKSNRGIANFNADRTGGASISVSFGERVDANFDRAVYAGFIKDDDGSLTQFGSVVVDQAGAGGDFPAELPFTDKSVVIYAYGIKVTSERASAAFGNMICPSAEQVAKLITTSSDVAAGTAVTKTKGLTMLEGTDIGTSDDDTHLVVSVSSSGIGTVTGGGRYYAGQPCTVVATPVGGSTFVAWHLNTASGPVMSTNATYSFVVALDIALVAVFEGGVTPTYQVSASANPADGGSVTGTGSYEFNSRCTLVATPNSGMLFQHWTENGVVVATTESYSFNVTRNRTLVAHFINPSQNGFLDVTCDGEPFNTDLNRSAADGVGVITGSLISPSTSPEGVCLRIGSNMPEVGSVITNRIGFTNNTSHFTIGNPTYREPGSYWLVGVAFDPSQELWLVTNVYDYKVTLT